MPKKSGGDAETRADAIFHRRLQDFQGSAAGGGGGLVLRGGGPGFAGDVRPVPALRGFGSGKKVFREHRRLAGHRHTPQRAGRRLGDDALRAVPARRRLGTGRSRARWAIWLAIGESAFFIPVEIFELVRRRPLDPANHPHLFSHPRTGLAIVLAVNVLIVWYLFENRHRLFRHHG